MSTDIELTIETETIVQCSRPAADQEETRTPGAAP